MNKQTWLLYVINHSDIWMTAINYSLDPGVALPKYMLISAIQLFPWNFEVVRGPTQYEAKSQPMG